LYIHSAFLKDNLGLLRVESPSLKYEISPFISFYFLTCHFLNLFLVANVAAPILSSIEEKSSVFCLHLPALVEFTNFLGYPVAVKTDA